jgi:multiple sugar transport system permease protein
MKTLPFGLTFWRWIRRVLLAVAVMALVAWTVFPFFWILLTSLKQPLDVIAAPPKVFFEPTTQNYQAIFIGQQRGMYASARPDFPNFFLNSIIISCGAVGLSFLAGIPASYALARYSFRFKEPLAFLFLSFRFAPFITFLIPLYILFQQLNLYNTYTGLILAYQLISLPFTVWMPLSLPGIAVTIILGFMFCWNAFNYPLMLAGRQTFPVTVGAIQFISYEQVLWGQMAAASLVAVVPQLILSLFVQKYIVRGLTMGAIR